MIDWRNFDYVKAWLVGVTVTLLLFMVAFAWSAGNRLLVLETKLAELKTQGGLKGPSGDKGPRGDKGEPGDQGPPGDAGFAPADAAAVSAQAKVIEVALPVIAQKPAAKALTNPYTKNECLPIPVESFAIPNGQVKQEQAMCDPQMRPFLLVEDVTTEGGIRRLKLRDGSRSFLCFEGETCTVNTPGVFNGTFTPERVSRSWSTFKLKRAG